MRPAPSHAQASVVGPNAVIQMAQALRAHGGEEAARRVFRAVGLLPLLADPPSDMIDERIPAVLHQSVARLFRPAEAQAIAFDAGTRTADYLLANRIPRLAQSLLRQLPRSVAARLLLHAIAKNAWTFTGSGTFSAQAGDPIIIEIGQNPLSTPGNPWHAATFQRLFRAIVAPEAAVRVMACCAAGAPACRFVITLAARPEA